MTIWKPHVTVAAVIEQEGRYLLVKESPDGHPVLNQPAGHLEEDETLHEAVVREVREETGRHFTPESIIGIYQYQSPHNNATYLRVAYRGSCSEPDPSLELDSDIEETLWMTTEEITRQHDKLRSPMVLRSIEDYQAGQSFPLTLINQIVHN